VITFRLLNELHDHPFDLHITYEGMNDDASQRAMPPFVTLEAQLMEYGETS
jgi:hypothetical protein